MLNALHVYSPDGIICSGNSTPRQLLVEMHIYNVLTSK